MYSQFSHGNHGVFWLCLQKYDKNGDGFLGADEVVKLAADLGFGKVTLDQAKNMIAVVDKNGDGKIGFEGMFSVI